MGADDLFNGVAIVIDDEIDEQGANISKLMAQIREKHIPCVTYNEIPDFAAIQHFSNISFLLLDWTLMPAEALAPNVKVGAELHASIVKKNISFLKKLTKTCFAPIFIFTNEDTNVVTDKLHEHDLYHNNIFVKNKSELTQSLFEEISKWARKVPSVYVLKEWEACYRSAINALFLDFYRQSPAWPKILWETFEADKVNSSRELGEVITRNLYTRMAPFSFDNESITAESSRTISKKELRSVLEGERFIKKTGLHHDSIAVGDVFKLSGGIYINIRPDCDCIPDRNSSNVSLDSVLLYLLKGSKLSDAKEKKNYQEELGKFEEIDCQAVVFCMVEGKTYDFRFKDVTIRSWAELKNHRIGRLLPPHITRIQQRFAMYIQRQGLPRIPHKAIHDL